LEGATARPSSTASPKGRRKWVAAASRLFLV
jgi:hypothetical protein